MGLLGEFVCYYYYLHGPVPKVSSGVGCRCGTVRSNLGARVLCWKTKYWDWDFGPMISHVLALISKATMQSKLWHHRLQHHTCTLEQLADRFWIIWLVSYITWSFHFLESGLSPTLKETQGSFITKYNSLLQIHISIYNDKWTISIWNIINNIWYLAISVTNVGCRTIQRTLTHKHPSWLVL